MSIVQIRSRALLRPTDADLLPLTSNRAPSTAHSKVTPWSVHFICASLRWHSKKFRWPMHLLGARCEERRNFAGTEPSKIAGKQKVNLQNAGSTEWNAATNFSWWLDGRKQATSEHCSWIIEAYCSGEIITLHCSNYACFGSSFFTSMKHSNILLNRQRKRACRSVSRQSLSLNTHQSIRLVRLGFKYSCEFQTLRTIVNFLINWILLYVPVQEPLCVSRNLRSPVFPILPFFALGYSGKVDVRKRLCADVTFDKKKYF